LTLTGRRFANPGDTTISMSSTGGLTFNLNQVNPEANAPTSSIQSAIDAIGSVAGNRTINLGSGTYTGETITIDRSVDLNGTGASTTTLSGNNAYRVLTITPGSVVNLSDLTIANGRVMGYSSDAYGGGIYNSGMLTINNSTLSRNSTSNSGGGIYNNGTLILTNSTLSGNSASAFYGGGGGIYNSGALTISNSTLSGNSARSGGGGGIFNHYYSYDYRYMQGYGGMLNIANSTLSGNSAPYGGGISNSGALSITNSTLSGNSASSGGGIFNGGIYNRRYVQSGSTLSITNSTLSSNSASSGGGIYNQNYGTIINSTLSGNSAGSGGGIDNPGTLTISNSTLSGNSASSNGGGIRNGRMLTIINSTLSGNSASGNGGGIYNEGGFSFPSITCALGGCPPGGKLSISNSTISNNSAIAGGGIYNDRGSTLYYPSIPAILIIRNNLITGNWAATGREVVSRGIATSEGYNLFGHSGSSGVDGMALNATDIVPRLSLDLILAPLANNGGTTQTHALVPGSPAIDRGDPNLTTPDQRGIARVRRADVGAFEFQGAAPADEILLDVVAIDVTLPRFSPVDFSEITAALHGQSIVPLTVTLQPESAEPLLCIDRSSGDEGRAIDEYPGLPDCLPQ
jgi:hypothetical protein